MDLECNSALFFYKVLWRDMQPIKPGKPGQIHSLYNKCTGFFYVHYTTHWTYGLASHLKDAAKQPGICDLQLNPF